MFRFDIEANLCTTWQRFQRLLAIFSGRVNKIMRFACCSLLIATPSAVAKQICKCGCSYATQSQPATHNQAQYTAVGTGINSIVHRCCCCSDCCCCCTCWRNKPHCIAFIATAAATLVARCTQHVA